MMRDSKTQPDCACWRTRREVPRRRFPPSWSVDDPNMKLGQDCYIVRDHNGQALALRSAKAT
jgi:hypothetical protein